MKMHLLITSLATALMLMNLLNTHGSPAHGGVAVVVGKGRQKGPTTAAGLLILSIVQDAKTVSI